VQGARLGDATVAANALLLNGLLLTAHALDGLAHAVEALCGHAIGARDREALRRSLVVACGWSLLASLGFAVLFLFAGHLFIEMQTNIQSVRDTAFIYLPYLAALPLIAVGSYLLDGLFIGATRAREMRNGMLLTVMLLLPFAWALQGFAQPDPRHVCLVSAQKRRLVRRQSSLSRRGGCARNTGPAPARQTTGVFRVDRSATSCASYRDAPAG
jgi:Na+-driven multidrug efflux pump